MVLAESFLVGDDLVELGWHTSSVRLDADCVFEVFNRSISHIKYGGREFREFFRGEVNVVRFYQESYQSEVCCILECGVISDFVYLHMEVREALREQSV